MRKLLTGMLFLGLANLAYSQSTNDFIEEVKLSEVTISDENLAYIQEVGDGTISDRVFTLEREASRYNIKESPFFSGRSGLNKVKIAKKNDYIMASYDGDGNILYTYERYKNIALPPAVRNKVFSLYPNWDMSRNIYLVSYDHKKGSEKVYKIQLVEEGSKKKMDLKFDSDGNTM